MCTPLGCVTTKRERVSTLGKDKEGVNAKEKERKLQHTRERASTPRKKRKNDG
jgi:hypothetical protein